MPRGRAVRVGEHGPTKPGRSSRALAGAARTPATSVSFLQAGLGTGWGQEAAEPGSGTSGLSLSTALPRSGYRPAARPVLIAGAGRPVLAGGMGRTASQRGGCGQRLFPCLPVRLASFAPAPEAAATCAERSRAGPGLRPRQPCCPQVLSSHPLSLQVNNATARVMTNKKAANPYTNGKGQHEESWSCGGPGHPWAPLLPGCH